MIFVNVLVVSQNSEIIIKLTIEQNKLNIKMTINRIHVFAFLITTLLAVKINAQTTEIKISFEEYIISSSLPGSGLDEASWSIFDKKGDKIATGNSEEIFNFKFEQPGDYFIRFVHEHRHNGHAATCNHYAMPNEVKINVSARKILFDTEKITFSKKIISGAASDGLIMYVPITLIGENNDDLVEMNKTIISYGINTTLIGKLSTDQFWLKPGNHILQYKLEGTATKDTYIGFDLIDLNGNVVPFGLNEPIQ